MVFGSRLASYSCAAPSALSSRQGLVSKLAEQVVSGTEGDERDGLGTEGLTTDVGEGVGEGPPPAR
jgi:hypothetical protein